MDMVHVSVVSGLIPQSPLQRRGGAVLSLIMFTTIVYYYSSSLAIYGEGGGDVTA
jgi:hypothetical protein